MGDSVVEITDTPPDAIDQSSCFICGLKFGLLSQQQRRAHITTCLDPLPESPPSVPFKPSLTSFLGAESCTQSCPTCDRDLSSYTPTRRLQHVNRCLDQHNGLPSDDIAAIRSAHILENGGNRKRNSTASTVSRDDVKDSTYSDRPPPMSMNMLDKDYICPICNKKLGGEFRGRVNHVTSCAAKNDVDAKKIEQLKRQQEASLSAERAEWEEKHPEFSRGDISSSQPSAPFYPSEKSSSTRKSRKKVTSAAIAAHVQQKEAQTALRPFFPSQLLDESDSQNHSIESHRLTWGSNGTPDRANSDEPRASLSSSPSPSPPTRFSHTSAFKSVNLGEYDSDMEREMSIDIQRRPQTAKQSRFGYTPSTALYRPQTNINDIDDDIEWDSLPTQQLNARRGEKRRATDDLPSSPESSAKKPKSAESTTNFLGINIGADTVIILDSPVNSQGAPAPPNDFESSSTLQDRNIHLTGTQTALDCGKDTSDSEESDTEFWLRSISGKRASLDSYLPLNHDPRTLTAVNVGQRSPTRNQTLEDAEISSSPPTPPLAICTTPPRAKSTSTVDDFIDLSSPVRVTLPKTLTASFPVSSSSGPLVASNDTLEKDKSPLAPFEGRNGRLNEPAVEETVNSVPDDGTPFHSELDAIITKFHQLEKQAEETYYATLGRITVQKDQQIRQLASHFAVDMATATRALHIRSAKVTAPNISAIASPLRLPVSRPIAQTYPSIPIPTPSELQVSEPRYPPQATQDIRVMSDRTTPMQGMETISVRSSQPALPHSSTDPQVTSSSSSVVSRNNSRPNLNDQSSNSNAIQRPNFDGMNNVQLSALASKFGLQTNLSRTLLVSQLEAIWQHYKMQFSGIIEQPSFVASRTVNVGSVASRTTSQTAIHPSVSENQVESVIVASNEAVSVPNAKRSRSRASKATTAAIPTSTSSLPTTTSTVVIDTSLGVNERLDQFVKGNVDLYATMLHYTSVDVLEFQTLLKQNKIKISRQDLQHYLQSRGFLYTLKKTASGKAVTASNR